MLQTLRSKGHAVQVRQLPERGLFGRAQIIGLVRVCLRWSHLLYVYTHIYIYVYIYFGSLGRVLDKKERHSSLLYLGRSRIWCYGLGKSDACWLIRSLPSPFPLCTVPIARPCPKTGGASRWAGSENRCDGAGTIPTACYPRLSCSKHHANCMGKVGLDLN